MSVELLLALIGTAATILSGVAVIARWAVDQFEKRLDERFAAQEKARTEGSRIWSERLQRMEERQERGEEKLNKLLIELPREYVRREDWVRSQSVIEAKLDSLALRIENLSLRGGRSD